MRAINTGDFETDPFAFRVVVKPFVAGFYNGTEFTSFWNMKCISQLLEFMDHQPPSYTYFHNGGKFDFLLGMLEHARGPVKIINGRVVEMTIGQHIYRDSFAILPVPLKAYDKDDIDYQKLRRSCREKHREEIIKYLRKDCVSLHELVSAFISELGNRLTIAGASMNQLKKFHEFETGNETYDSKFRKDFYRGGRVQCFQTGVIKQPLKIYDENSAYPAAMKNYLHPVGTECHVSDRIEDDTCFLTVEGRNMGAFPQKAPDGSLTFTSKSGIFHTTIHEWHAALDTGTFEPKRIIETIGFQNRINFAEFITHFWDKRVKAKLDLDRIHDIFYKLVPNSSYGRFAINPENFYEYRIEPINRFLADLCPVCKGVCSGCGESITESACECNTEECHWCEGYGTAWIRAHIREGKYVIWRQPSMRKNYCNIATGASITGAARAMLLRGLAGAVNPIYCDTDSIICESLSGVVLSDTELGAWKCEGSGDAAAIAGKKLYAIFAKEKPVTKPGAPEPEKTTLGYVVKKAHKGAKATGQEIIRAARGGVIETRSPVPAFKLNGAIQWTTRRLRRTGI